MTDHCRVFTSKAELINPSNRMVDKTPVIAYTVAGHSSQAVEILLRLILSYLDIV